ncbi:MAG: Flp pilus assembly complex ATPase component TadA [Desulfuromonadales bacterium]|nr:Flp pilus assembly complex ATPase component TadA [Desulfuromonadales bacterium]
MPEPGTPDPRKKTQIFPAAKSSPASHGGEGIARLLIEQGLITEEQLTYTKRVKTKLISDRSLVEIFKALRLLTNQQLSQVLKQHRLDLRIGDLLVELGHIREGDLDAALAIQAENKKQKIGEILVEYGFIDEHSLMEILASQLGYPFIEPVFADIGRDLLAQVPAKMLSQHAFVPVARSDDRVIVAFADPLDLEDREAADRVFGRKIVPAISPRQGIRAVIELYRRGARRGTVASADDSTIIGIVNNLFDDAMQQGASDIHIEPMKGRLRIRFRRDGVLGVHKEMSLDVAAPLATRLKVMAEADIAERRRHQDGRILYESAVTGMTLDLRVSFYITIHGEKIVLRLMNKKGELLDIDDIGMAPRMLQQFREDALASPSGIIVVTGPTGAGKTTTLYSCVNNLNNLEVSIITAEEPVEYVLDGISQCSINPKIGVTFTETLRHIVRQDPDIIVMGEIRDAFSAETAIQAALTGHKVLTTFHTEDAVGGLLRLLNMGIEAFLIASTINCMLAQRLLRRVCPHCTTPFTPTPEEYRWLGYTHGDLAGADLQIGRGCTACRFTGYKGRVGIFELLYLNDNVKEAVLARKTVQEIRRISIESSGLITLMEDGIAKAARGKVSLPEVMRRLPRILKPRPLHELRRLLGE